MGGHFWALWRGHSGRLWGRCVCVLCHCLAGNHHLRQGSAWSYFFAVQHFLVGHSLLIAVNKQASGLLGQQWLETFCATLCNFPRTQATRVPCSCASGAQDIIDAGVDVERFERYRKPVNDLKYFFMFNLDTKNAESELIELLERPELPPPPEKKKPTADEQKAISELEKTLNGPSTPNKKAPPKEPDETEVRGAGTCMRMRRGGGIQGRIPVSQSLCETFLRKLFSGFKVLHG